VRVAAAEFEGELASARAQLQQDRATLEGAQSWQSQAEEKAKQAELLRTSLADKAASLASTEERLQQEQDVRHQAQAQLQQERAALAEARAALECERLVQEEAHDQLQQERTALEGAQATLKQRDEEVSRLNKELTQLSVSHKDLRQSLEEQEDMVLGLRQAAEDARKTLEAERKQVEGESLFGLPFALSVRLVWDLLPTFVFCLWFSGLRTALGSLTTAVQTAYNSSQQELEELRAATLEACQEVEEGKAHAESSMASRLRALGGHVTRRMRRTLHLGVQKALGVVASHYQVNLEAVSRCPCRRRRRGGDEPRGRARRS
jgi:myosin heavy subunit